METEKSKKPYKVNIGDTIKIKRTEINGRMFYSTSVTQKQFDGTKKYYNKRLNFKKGVSIPNDTRIKILDMFENMWDNPKDPYNPVSILMILDYEIIKNSEQIEKDALEEYRDDVFGDEELSSDLFM